MEKNLYIDASHPNETRVVLKSKNNIEEGKPIWDITKEYLKAVGTYKVDQSHKIKIVNEDGNIGIET